MKKKNEPLVYFYFFPKHQQKLNKYRYFYGCLLPILVLYICVVPLCFLVKVENPVFFTHNNHLPLHHESLKDLLLYVGGGKLKHSWVFRLAYELFITYYWVGESCSLLTIGWERAVHYLLLGQSELFITYYLVGASCSLLIIGWERAIHYLLLGGSELFIPYYWVGASCSLLTIGWERAVHYLLFGGRELFITYYWGGGSEEERYAYYIIPNNNPLPIFL